MVETSPPLSETVMSIRSIRSIVTGQTPISAAKTTTVVDAARLMKQQNIGALLVLDSSRLIGIFTERDVLNKLSGKDAVVATTLVKDLMSANPETLRETDSVATALNKMSMGRYRHIPVQRTDGSYSVTSIKHVLKYIAKADW